MKLFLFCYFAICLFLFLIVVFTKKPNFPNRYYFHCGLIIFFWPVLIFMELLERITK